MLEIFGRNVRFVYREYVIRMEGTSKVLYVTKNNVFGSSGESIGNNLNRRGLFAVSDFILNSLVNNCLIGMPSNALLRAWKQILTSSVVKVRILKMSIFSFEDYVWLFC